MRILITNDDGINAQGLQVLHAIATRLAGADGEVWTVAPAFEQSGVGHCISYTRPFMISELSPRRFAAEGSPADCVLAGLHNVLQDQKPDLILSGVNRGNNSAENTLYSGTLGAAMEGALQGIPSFALSQYYGPDNKDLDNPFEAAAAFGVEAISKVLQASTHNPSAYQLFYNINFPPVPAAAVKGLRYTAQGLRQNTHFSASNEVSPNGRHYTWIKGGDQRAPTAPGTDAASNLDGYVSITPMRADLTAHDVLEALQSAP
ncbi:5'/3'-nucleotidase SurE [Epibacterium sp. SM1979]|uniref:5'-nucleotidase SurE n=1 Tax=Tritonibacter litoralis TaxID=2662264 RepID=A0A843YCW2_9RHOB|nr:5'/3'-nucleotidase SurE [Tritonibacter litoralis]MQQ07505.1 5'/3'-nucleotidase SurE [Tritonibacter litoralis]